MLSARRIHVDTHEKTLWEALQKKTAALEASMRPPLECRQMNVADVQFVADYRKNDTPDEEYDTVGEIYFERKTMKDMCASIKDGRYREQKVRLKTEAAKNNNAKIVYLLEGYSGFGEALSRSATQNGLQPTALKSCVYNLMVEEGIYVLFTLNTDDTADTLLALWTRHCKRNTMSASTPMSTPPIVYCPEKKQQQMQEMVACEDNAEHLSEHARSLISCSVHAKKAKNITQELFYTMQLCQLPGVSEKTARVITSKWPNMAAMYAHLLPMEAGDRVKEFSALPTIGPKNAQRMLCMLFPE